MKAQKEQTSKKKIKKPVRDSRTLREITNIIQRLREMGAITIEVGDIKSTFLPLELSQGKAKVEKDLPISVPVIKEKQTDEEIEEKDLFNDGF